MRSGGPVERGVQMVSSAGRFMHGLLAPIPLIVLAIGSGLSVFGFMCLSQATAVQESRLLSNRADEAAIVVESRISAVDASLTSLAAIGDYVGKESGQLFEQLAGQRVTGRTTAVGLAVPVTGGYDVSQLTGTSAGFGAVIDPAFEEVLARASRLETPGLVSEVVGAGDDRRTVFARTAGGDTVAFQETLATEQPFSPSQDSAFTGLRVALYAASTASPDRVVMTSESDPPMSGMPGVTTRPIAVGDETWQMAVASDGPLVSPLTAATPWLGLLAGLVATLLAAIAVATVARRRDYAEQIADERTRSLASTLDDLARTRAFLTDVLTCGPTVVVVSTIPDRRVTYLSPNLKRELGIDPATLSDERPLGARIHHEDLAATQAVLQSVLDGAVPARPAEYRIADDSGEYRWVAATIVPLDSAPDGRDTTGEKFVLAYLVDIDQRRRADDELRAATAAAEAANLSKSQFLSRMSHELRTPLNAIIGFGQLLELDDLTDEQGDSVDHILKGGRHLLTLINEVLDISRVEAGELSLSPEAVLAGEVVDDAVNLIRPLAEQRGISVHSDTTACSCHVYADRQRVKQVLLNLLSNAIKYNRPQGSILVRCEQTPAHLRIDVTDTGLGIAAERLDLLFTPFERLGAEHTAEEGTGIGLALSKRLTEAMGGTLVASSGLGQGTTFSLTLPLAEGPVERLERLGTPTVPEPPVLDRRAVVLHVEDNASNVALVERILAARPNVQLVAATHGTLAVELARHHRPVLVLLDLHLPDLDGEEVLRRLRDDPATASIPVVIVSADATRGQVQRILTAGAAAYLTKPVDVRELLHTVDDAVTASVRPHEDAR